MKSMIKLGLAMILCASVTIKINAEAISPSIKSTNNPSSSKTIKPLKIDIKPNIQKKPKLIVIERTIFENCRVNDIILTLTDHKNRSFSVPVKMGQKYEYYNRFLPDHLFKVICSDKNSPKVTLPKQDLESYSAFVFNDEQNTNKYHFINPFHKAVAKKRVRDHDPKNLELLETIDQQSIYHP